MRHNQDDLDAIMSKIEGLLNMTEDKGCTPAEAAAAAEAVERILTKYNLDRSQLKFDQKETTGPEIKQDFKKYSEKLRFRNVDWIDHIAYGVGRMYYCTTWTYRSGYVTFVGEAHDIAVAQTVLKWLVEQGHHHCKYVWKNRHEFGVHHMTYLPFETSFYDGFGDGARDKIEEVIKERHTEQGVAGLVVDKRAQIDEYLKATYPEIYDKVEDATPAKPKKPRKPPKEKYRKGSDPSAYYRGVKMGKKTSLNKQEEIEA